ncbi:guanine nucleotide binding protein alpha transducing activity polypeptide 2 [Rhizoclosmatium globosum]|uniref:Guanine nucleotide binding protein alpha transducing activity polypeptide 2 n=1 Tax=Rhizoclosmatium globosum TaxID=329046 RepID=A0A1Y2BQ57_9FUNG|nr:guanine nucleotide binding protein alpha transducing activity polypeptide 2 [Rhizoclosmatium globosum]|eukprot:ORY36878.1 guanine nucleotide binding protein alpha transducing activity polypeptide 2 [Rhizoclosmatium globosum]
MDCCSYLMDNFDRIIQPDYVPTERDILNTRVMTVKASETKFIAEDLEFRVFDVGGQRSERMKWAQFFDDVTAVIFVAAISSYDQTLFEDEKTNRMMEALTLFNSTINHPIFRKTSIILFLNKIDLFKEKLKTKPVSLYFPTFQGPDTFEASAQFFIKRFKGKNSDRQIYAHLTWATDTQQTKIVLKAVVDIIVRGAIADLGLT